jgi:hypothetical protein
MDIMTIEIKLMNRIKPVGMEGYKKAPKLPRRIRSSVYDDLNRWTKDFEVMPYQTSMNVWSLEISRLMKDTPWKFGEENMDFGDMLIGYMSESFGDYGKYIFKKH